MILNGSGCLDALAAPDVARALDVFVTKTVTPLPREGNAPVRIAETEVGMLNSIGLANPGIDRFVAESLPGLARLGVPIWVSVGGFSASDYEVLCGHLDKRDEVAAIELNLSCPNVQAPDGGVAELVAGARAATAKPLYAKLSPALPDVGAVALAAERAGVDGLTLVNTIRGLSLDDKTLAPTLSRSTGGLSGPALRPIALAAVHECYTVSQLPIVGVGGVESGRHALELIAVGASAVGLGTILFREPGAPARVRAELASELRALGLSDVAEARGLAHTQDVALLPV
jgi:dihydroorotate dehydrogenase (NAD+) catalytic subunit